VKIDWLGDGFAKARDGGRVPLAALISGGKDSWFAAHLMSELGYTIKCAVVILPRRDDSWMFHVPGVGEVPDMLRERGVDVVVRESCGEKEKELDDLREALEEAKSRGAEGVVTGAIASNYQRVRIEALAGELGLACYSPLWGADPAEYVRHLAAEGFRFKIVSVAARGLDLSWVGREIGPAEAEELLALAEKYRFHPAGEGGEYETLVVDAPGF
jgi:diphthine-ammonia ligase